MAIKGKGFDQLRLCFFEALFDKFYFVRNLAKCWRLLDFDRLQRMNTKRHRFVGCHNH